jgi:predicted DNA-binding transcriptional regulator YafY
VLQRLLYEAQAQGAAPTDDDLAAALDVSRRTVLRDMAALQAAGVAVQTRARP